MRLASILALTIIILSVAAIAPVIGQAITVTIDKTSYRPGETVRVSGTAPPNVDVIVTLTNPGGKEINFQNRSDAQGIYRVDIAIPPTIPYPPGEPEPFWVTGIYTVRAWIGPIASDPKTFTLTLGGVVRGNVVDELGIPVQGATVTVLQTGASTSTDINGIFSIETGPGNFTLEITKAGYLRVRVNVSVSPAETKDLGTLKLFSVEFVISQLQVQIANLTSQNAALAAQVIALQTQLNSTSTAIAALQAQVANLSSSLGALAAEFRAAQAALTVALGNISSKLDTLSSDLRNSFSSINSSLSAITSRLAALDDLRTTVSGLRQDITGMRNDIGDLKTGQGQISGKIDTLSSRLDTVATNLGNAINSAQSSISNAVSSAVAGVSSKIDTVSGKIDSLSSGVSGLTAPLIVAVILALLAFVFALLTFLQVRRAMAAK